MELERGDIEIGNDGEGGIEVDGPVEMILKLAPKPQGQNS